MPKKLTWDNIGERVYETGVQNMVLYPRDASGTYPTGVAWNGVTDITESPSGAEATPQYADNIQYLNLVSAEKYGSTIEAFTYPEEFAECDGSAEIAPGVYAGQQNRKTFGYSYRTILGNDVDLNDHGYKLHLVYGALAAPSEKSYSTVNESPDAMKLSWEVSTTPVAVPGFKPTSILTLESTKVDPDKLEQLENILYGSDSAESRLPLPEEVIALLSDESAQG